MPATKNTLGPVQSALRQGDPTSRVVLANGGGNWSPERAAQKELERLMRRGGKQDR